MHKSLLLIVFNGLVKLPILSPAILFTIISPLLLIGVRRNWKVKKDFFYPISISLLFFLLVTYQVQHIDLKYGALNEYFRHVFPWIFASVGFLFWYQRSQVEIEKIFVGFAWILVLSSISRILYSFIFVGSGFYSLKYSSIFYPDSNFEGFLGLVFYLMASRSKSENFYSARWLFLVVCLLSLSRAVWIVLALYFLKTMWFKQRRHIQAILLLILLFPMLYFMYFFINTVKVDGSFITKLELIQVIFVSFAKTVWLDELLFGIGSGNLIDFYGRESHNLFGLTVEMGLVWLTVYVIAFVYVLKKCLSSVDILFVFLPACISLFPVAYMGPVFLGCYLLDKRRYIQPVKIRFNGARV